MRNLYDLLEIAKKAALSSGNFLKKEFHRDHETFLNKGRDIKLKIDIFFIISICLLRYS